MPILYNQGIHNQPGGIIHANETAHHHRLSCHNGLDAYAAHAGRARRNDNVELPAHVHRGQRQPGVLTVPHRRKRHYIHANLLLGHAIAVVRLQSHLMGRPTRVVLLTHFKIILAKSTTVFMVLLFWLPFWL